jgi:sigma-E factor negative regulatory protein RseB
VSKPTGGRALGPRWGRFPAAAVLTAAAFNAGAQTQGTATAGTAISQGPSAVVLPLGKADAIPELRLGAAAPTASLAEAKAWFARMQGAAASSNFQGTLVYSAAGTVSSTRVAHYAVDGQVFEMLEALDGQQHRMARHNDTVHMLWPQTQVAVIEKRETLAAWSTTPQRIDAFALEQYELRREADARVAGRHAAVFWMQPRDGLRYAQRFWADRATGLMLRADLLVAQQAPAPAAVANANPPAQPKPGSGGEWQPLESTAFSALELGVVPKPQQVLQGMQPGAGYTITRPQQRLTALDAEGWVLARPVPGFRLAASVLRGMEAASPRVPVFHALFTDGLTLVSLFVESFDAQLHRAESAGQRGATASLTQRRGEHWFVAVGDVPVSTLKLFVAALDRRGP